MTKLLALSEQIQLPNDVRLDWYGDRQIVIYVVEKASTRATVDTFADAIIETANNWPIHEKPYLSAGEFPANMALTPYARHRMNDTFNDDPNLHGRFALIQPNSPLGMALRLYFNYEYRRSANRAIEGRAFSTREEAIAWLAAYEKHSIE